MVQYIIKVSIEDICTVSTVAGTNYLSLLHQLKGKEVCTSQHEGRYGTQEMIFKIDKTTFVANKQYFLSVRVMQA